MDRINKKIAYWANNLLNPVDLLLMTKDDLVRLFGHPGSATATSNADSYLCLNNPWLKNLENTYADMKHRVSPDTTWDKKYLRRIKLTQFREDNPYVWQISDRNTAASYGLTYYYIQTLDRFKLLDKLIEDGVFGATVFDFDDRLISRDLLDSVTEIYFLDSVLGTPGKTYKTLLDIGAGYGRLAHRLTQAFPDIRVLCTDAIALSSFICDYYLRYRRCDRQASVIPLDQVSNALSIVKPDLAVNIHSWSECHLGWVRWWLDLLVVNRVKYLMIVPDRSDLTCETNTKYRPNYQSELEKRGYRLKTKRPKYESVFVQHYGISPSTYYLFELNE